jgi:hypothetical protein
MSILHSALHVTASSAVGIYLARSVLEAISTLRYTYNPRVAPQSKQQYMDAITRHSWQRSVTMAYLLPVAITWPSHLRYINMAANRTNDLEFGARVRLNRPDIRIGATSAILCVSLFVLAWRNWLWAPLFVAAAFAVLMSVVIRHCFYIFTSIAERLRRSPGNPFALFLALAAFDALTLITGIALLDLDRGDPGGSIRRSALNLFNVPNNISELTERPATQAVVTLIGIIYYVTFVKPLANPREFRRTDEDLRALASTYLMSGDLPKARDWLSQEKQRHADSYALRGQIYLMTSRFDDAVDQAHQALRARGEEDSTDAAHLEIVLRSFYTHVSLSHRRRLIEYLLEKGATDIALSRVITQATAIESQSEEFAGGLLDRVAASQYPLSRTLLLIAVGDFTEAHALLERSTPGSEIEELIRITMQCSLVLIDPDVSVEDTHLFLAEWFRDSFPVVRDVARSISRSTERTIASGFLVELLVLHDRFVKMYENAHPYNADEVDHQQRLLMNEASELAESERQFTQIKLAHREIVAGLPELPDDSSHTAGQL